TKVLKTVCETVCVPTQVACAPPAPACNTGGRTGLFGRLCHKPTCEPACAPPCPAPCAPSVQTVMVKQVVARQVEVEVNTCTMVTKEGVRKVRVPTPTWVEKDVTVMQCVATPREGTRTVLVPTWVEKDVPVTKLVPTEVESVRKVCQPFTTKKWVDVSYCERVAYETTIKVPVAAPCTPAPVCCN
ncbi:MAG TPA: hypothetical protein VH092_06265, partial [Urbifossiella sp.]|nr:hypothetical protein [Urbifossiella sp.]